jgi:hypothetical protein
VGWLLPGDAEVEAGVSASNHSRPIVAVDANRPISAHQIEPEESVMPEPSPAPAHVHITKTYVHFYVLLTQFLDRCLDEETHRIVPEAEFQHQLDEIHSQVEDLLSTNRVVKEKAQRDYERVKAVAADLARNPGDEHREKALKTERGRLQTKIAALSDLLAIFCSD